MKRLLLIVLSVVMLLACMSCSAKVSSDSVSDGQGVLKPDLVFISEVMADNSELCMGHSFDFVEICNGKDDAVTLDGYYLTDDMTVPDALPLAGHTVPAGGYVVITLDAEAPFHLSSEGESVYLTDGKAELFTLTYPQAQAGVSYDLNGACEYTTPGFDNNAEGYGKYLETIPEPELVINELLPSNSMYYAPDGQTYDMVEIKNVSDKVIDLSLYSLSDKQKEPERYSFPALTLAPGELYVVYCSGDSTLGDDHASFKLSAEKGESVYLAKEGSIFHKLSIPADLPKNESYGRGENGLRYFSVPTIGAENDSGYESPVGAPTADKPSGVYESTTRVSLSGDGTIYYTLDGSRPTTDSAVYSEPIEISGVTTLRAFSLDGERQSALAAYTYVVGKEHDLPIVCVSIPQESLTGEADGVLNHVEETFEHECQLTLIEQGEERFTLPCGFRLHGYGSRQMPKQNFQLRFRSDYGPSKLVYKLFDNRDFDTFDSLLLKGGSEDYASAVMRDEVGTLAAEGGTALYTQAYKPVALYLGGEYWGVYYIRERFSDDYVAEHLGVSPESVDLLYSSGGYRQDGSDADFKELKNFVQWNDMSLDENYEYLLERIDADSLMDWYICRSYMGDKDLANIRRFRSTESDGKWRWMYYDLDWAFCTTNDYPVSSLLTNYNGEPILINALLSHEKGRDAFLRRYALLMKTVLNEEHMCSVVDRIASDVESEMERDRQRWGSSVEFWEKSVQRIRDYFADGKRDMHVKEDIKAYFGLSDEEMNEYFGE